MFYTFRKNQVEMILHNATDLPITIAYKDITAFSQEKEYIRRFYSNSNKGYGSEIHLKMKLIISNHPLIVDSYSKVK